MICISTFAFDLCLWVHCTTSPQTQDIFITRSSMDVLCWPPLIFPLALLRKKRVGVWRKKTLKADCSLLPSVIELGSEKRLKKKVTCQEIRKEIYQCRIFPHGILTRDTANAVAGSDHPVRSMRWKRHRTLAQIYEGL